MPNISEKNTGGRMPLVDHLDELRSALIRVLCILFVGVLVTYTFSEKIVLFLQQPLLHVLPAAESKLYYTGITDKFLIYIKVSIISALALCSPYILFEIWRFISPGLYAHERKVALPFIIFGSFSFIVGLAFAYYVLIPYSYDFLINFGSTQDRPIITLTEYFGLTLKFLLSMGLVFELPALLILLSAIGIVEADFLVKNRPYAIVVIAISSALLTPPDAFTMIIVMAPLWVLYEFSIFAVRLVAKRQIPAETH